MIHRSSDRACASRNNRSVARNNRARGASRIRPARGFTLIEVLVAMTIIAVGVSAIVVSAGASAWRADFLRQREQARWVASNVLTQWQSLPAWPEIGTTNTEVEMARQTWYVRTRTQRVADADLRRMDVEVRLNKDEESYIFVVTSFIGNPALRQGYTEPQ